jgi:hypothetical protein
MKLKVFSIFLLGLIFATSSYSPIFCHELVHAMADEHEYSHHADSTDQDHHESADHHHELKLNDHTVAIIPKVVIAQQTDLSWALAIESQGLRHQRVLSAKHLIGRDPPFNQSIFSYLHSHPVHAPPAVSFLSSL